MSEKMVDEDSDNLRGPDAAIEVVVVVVIAVGRETSLEQEAVLSVALLERRRLNGLRWASDAMELRRFMEARLESEEGAASLDRDFREGMLVPYKKDWLIVDGLVLV